MNITSLVTALPEPASTGWGTCGKRLPEELAKLAFVQNLHAVNGGLLLKQDFPVDFNVPIIEAIRGVDLLPIYPQLRGSKNVGISFAEDNLLLRKYGPRAKCYWDVIACGSTWARNQMLVATEAQVPIITAIQGVDSDIFCPSETVKSDPDWFTIFSGGKFELRKSQDVVIRAVKVMMERHKDVRLVASWWNPWEHSLETMRQSKLITIPTGRMDFVKILAANGIVTNYSLLSQCTHKEMAYHLNRCDVGLFPNRCEAGTNLVLMEAMACGLPVIATISHGHADVAALISQHTKIHSAVFTVERSGMAVAEWYEPDLDATIDALEWAYGQRGDGRLMAEGECNREAIKQYSWAACAQTLLEACDD